MLTVLSLVTVTRRVVQYFEVPLQHELQEVNRVDARWRFLEVMRESCQESQVSPRLFMFTLQQGNNHKIYVSPARAVQSIAKILAQSLERVALVFSKARSLMSKQRGRWKPSRRNLKA